MRVASSGKNTVSSSILDIDVHLLITHYIEKTNTRKGEIKMLIHRLYMGARILYFECIECGISITSGVRLICQSNAVKSR